MADTLNNTQQQNHRSNLVQPAVIMPDNDRLAHSRSWPNFKITGVP